MYGIAVVGENVWSSKASQNIIYVKNVDGSSHYEDNFPITGNGLTSPYGIATVINGSTTYVWVVNYGNNTISVFNTDGTASGLGPYSGNNLGKPRDIAVVGSQIWITNDNAGTKSISRFNPDGSTAASPISISQAPMSIGVVGSKVWIGYYSSQIGVYNFDGTNTGTVYTGLPFPRKMAQVINSFGTFVWVINETTDIVVLNTDGTSAANSCTSSVSPCLTLSYATSKASPGDNVIMHGGTYGPQTISKSGTVGQLITVKPADGETVTFQRTNPASNTLQTTQLLTVSGRYVKVTGFTFNGMLYRSDDNTTLFAGQTSTGDDTQAEVQEAGGLTQPTYITFDHLTINNSTSGCIKFGQNGTATNNTLTNCGRAGHVYSHSIYVSKSDGYIANNTIRGTSGYGIHAYGTPNNEVILNNIVSEASNSGILVWGNNATIQGNLLYENSEGIDVQYSGHIISNNIIVNNTNNTLFTKINSDTTSAGNTMGLNLGHEGIAVVGSEVWVTNSVNNSISRFNSSGNDLGTDITGNGLNSPGQLTVIGSEVWVVNNNDTISRFNTDGTNAGSVLTGNGMISSGGRHKIEAVGSQVWVTNTATGGGSTISRFNSDGTSAGSVITGNGLSYSSAIGTVVLGDSSTQVWVGNINGGANGISRFNTDGTSAGTISGQSYPSDIQMIGSEVWIARSQSSPIYRYNPDGTSAGTTTFTSSGSTQIASVSGLAWVANNLASGVGINFQSGSNLNVKIYNNTFYNNHLDISTGSSAYEVLNNIFDESGFSSATAISNNPTGSAIDYNLYYNVTVPSFAGSHSISNQSPQLTNPTSGSITAVNYKLLSTSPAINTGTDLSATLTTDYAGTTRPQGSAFDIGAYEFILPSAPSSLTQYKSDGTTSIASSSWTNESTVVLKFLMSSSNTSDTLTPQVEIEPNGTAFTNTVTNSGSPVAYSGSPVTGTVTATGLTSGQTYHWQARVSNSAGTGSWTSSGGNPDFGADTTRPTSLSLNSPAGYTTDNRPTLVFKKATDTASGITSYTVTLDSGKNRNFSVSGIPASGNGSSDYVWKDDSSVKVEFLNENDSDTSNDEIHVYFKDLNNTQLTEGKHTWNVTAYDNVGNSASQSQDFYIDRSSPSISQLAVANVAVVQSGQTYALSILNRMPSFSGLASDSYQGSTVTNSNGTTDTFDKVTSGPQTITLTLKLQKDDKTYADYLTQDYSLSNIQDTSGDKKSTRFYVTTPFPIVDGYYQVNITLKDGAGNTFTQPTFYLSIKNNLPGPLQSLFTGNLETKITEQKTVPAQTEEEKQDVIQSGYTVKIKVVDTANKPIPGAKVTIHSKVQETTTDKNGIALFNSVESGQHKILIAYANYQGEQTVNLTGDVKEFDITIQVKQTNAFLSPQVMLVTGILVLIIAFLTFKLIKKNKIKKL